MYLFILRDRQTKTDSKRELKSPDLFPNDLHMWAGLESKLEAENAVEGSYMHAETNRLNH